MGMRMLSGLLILLACTGLAGSQTGTVTGEIKCGDTGLPARLATVRLEPVGELRSATPPSGNLFEDLNRRNRPDLVMRGRTDLGGRYRIEEVPQGRYWVVIDQPGYLSPFSNFSQWERQNPTAEINEKIAKVVSVAQVEAKGTTTADVVLERGGSIHGKVQFDDGTPVANMHINLLRGDSANTWHSISSGFGFDSRASLMTDADGDFSAFTLRPGRYQISITLDAIQPLHAEAERDITRSRNRSTEFYFGDVFRREEARTIELTDGQQVREVTLHIPIGKLHTVSGSVIDAATKKAVSAGVVTLSEPERLSPQRHEIYTLINSLDGTFRLEFVPEGAYVLTVEGARGVAGQPLTPASPAARHPESRYPESVMRWPSGDAVPLKVTGDVEKLAVSVSLDAKGSGQTGRP